MSAQDDTPGKPRTLAATAPVVLWIAVLLVLVASTIIGAALISVEFAAARPVVRERDAAAWPVARRDDGRVLIAGSGSNLPITRRLVTAFLRTRPRAELVVFESIGSTGGVKATYDGVVDLGLISRPLRASERRLALTRIPYARVAVVFAVNRGVRDHSIHGDDLVAIYEGARRQWSDGQRIVVFQRERGDSSQEAVAEVLPAFANANEEAYDADMWRVVYHDRAMQEALTSTPGAIGLADLGAVLGDAVPVKLLAIDGITPTPETVASGAYPFFKDLAFVSRGPPAGLAAEFLEFVASPAGQQIIRESGGAPLALVPEVSP
ncbi:MAG: substrate-binding domain-containing protein [Myxococcales bacterium]|nr:substrate-binding domain-containing protein [Myxococcales bacterium]